MTNHEWGKDATLKIVYDKNKIPVGKKKQGQHVFSFQTRRRFWSIHETIRDFFGYRLNGTYIQADAR